jgi:hypothetical protein
MSVVGSNNDNGLISLVHHTKISYRFACGEIFGNMNTMVNTRTQNVPSSSIEMSQSQSLVTVTMYRCRNDLSS